MGTGEGHCGDGPHVARVDGPRVPAVGVDAALAHLYVPVLARADCGGVPALARRHSNSVEVEPVAPRLGEQEQVIVTGGESVCDGLGHGVGLVPDDVVAEDPAVVL